MEIIIKETYQKGKDDDGGIYEIFDYDILLIKLSIFTSFNILPAYYGVIS